ncbi:hypothetical protein HZA41_02430 [Candidatus Peregrinibacteria bacterium]|nr:hypothetical protein [Candidatus Peregrinibacteria bacterium]
MEQPQGCAESEPQYREIEQFFERILNILKNLKRETGYDAQLEQIAYITYQVLKPCDIFFKIARIVLGISTTQRGEIKTDKKEIKQWIEAMAECIIRTQNNATPQEIDIPKLVQDIIATLKEIHFQNCSQETMFITPRDKRPNMTKEAEDYAKFATKIGMQYYDRFKTGEPKDS